MWSLSVCVSSSVCVCKPWICFERSWMRSVSVSRCWFYSSSFWITFH